MCSHQAQEDLRLDQAEQPDPRKTAPERAPGAAARDSEPEEQRRRERRDSGGSREGAEGTAKPVSSRPRTRVGARGRPRTVPDSDRRFPHRPTDAVPSFGVLSLDNRECVFVCVALSGSILRRTARVQKSEASFLYRPST